MTDDAAREALERALLAAGTNAVRNFDAADFAFVADDEREEVAITAAFRRLLTTHAIVPREMTPLVLAPIQRELIGDVIAVIGPNEAPMVADHLACRIYPAIVATGEVKLFGEGG